MPIPDELIERARSVDLLSYLESRGYPLKRTARNEYCLTNDTYCKISNNLWRSIGDNTGGNTLDFLVKYEGKPFRDAVFELAGAKPPSKALKAHSVRNPESKPRLPFTLPAPAPNNEQIIVYLTGRGIDAYIIQHCVDQGILYEEAKYHNAVFVGKDKDGTPKFAALRSTTGSFKGDAQGSSKRYGFSMDVAQPSDTLYVFESPIDALSYASLEKVCGNEWQNRNYLALCGFSDLALEQYLKDHSDIHWIALCLDNDTQGRKSTIDIQGQLEEKGYAVLDNPPPGGKDYNEHLKNVLRIRTIEAPERPHHMEHTSQTQYSR